MRLDFKGPRPCALRPGGRELTSRSCRRARRKNRGVLASNHRCNVQWLHLNGGCRARVSRSRRRQSSHPSSRRIQRKHHLGAAGRQGRCRRLLRVTWVPAIQGRNGEASQCCLTPRSAPDPLRQAVLPVRRLGLSCSARASRPASAVGVSSNVRRLETHQITPRPRRSRRHSHRTNTCRGSGDAEACWATLRQERRADLSS